MDRSVVARGPRTVSPRPHLRRKSRRSRRPLPQGLIALVLSASRPFYGRRSDGRNSLVATTRGRAEYLGPAPHRPIMAAPNNNVTVMTKSELIARIAQKQTLLTSRDVETAVNAILEQMTERLGGGSRVEIRGFGSFSLRHRPEWIGRNPMTGAPVSLPARHALHFKLGQRLRERVDIPVA